MTYKSLRMIAVSEENYLTLKGLRRAGDFFNDVITEMLKKRSLHTGPNRATNLEDQNATTEATTLEPDYTENE